VQERAANRMRREVRVQGTRAQPVKEHASRPVRAGFVRFVNQPRDHAGQTLVQLFDQFVARQWVARVGGLGERREQARPLQNAKRARDAARAPVGLPSHLAGVPPLRAFRLVLSGFHIVDGFRKNADASVDKRRWLAFSKTDNRPS
jgi:hypothetical protein